MNMTASDNKMSKILDTISLPVIKIVTGSKQNPCEKSVFFYAMATVCRTLFCTTECFLREKTNALFMNGRYVLMSSVNKGLGGKIFCVEQKLF